MSRITTALDPAKQRAVLRGDCYYCWLGQFDKCDANCNNRRAIPRYGNHDITPAGKLKPRTSAGGAETHDEWLINQANKATLYGSNSMRGGGGYGNDNEGRDRGAPIGVGGQAGRLSRFEILQENKRNWALRHPLLSTAPPQLASLATALVADGGGDGGGGYRYGGGGSSGGVLTDRSRGGATTPHRHRAASPSASTSYSTAAGARAAQQLLAHSQRPEHLRIQSCRLPLQPSIPHRHAAGSVKVQVTPYSFAEVSARSALLAGERERNGGVYDDAHRGHSIATNGNHFHHNHQMYEGSARGRSASAAASARRARSPSVAAPANAYAVGGGGSVYDGDDYGRSRRSASASAAAQRRSGAVNVVERGRSGVVRATVGGGPNTQFGGPTIRVRADETSSYILSAGVRSVRDMPLPELFQGLD